MTLWFDKSRGETDERGSLDQRGFVRLEEIYRICLKQTED